MTRDDRDDPFDEFFRELERMMNDVMGGAFEMDMDVQTSHGPAGFGADTHVDVYEEDDQLRVIADLPGVEKADIDLRCDGESLLIGAQSEHRDYDERVELPAHVDEHSASATYNNGVLEVVLDRSDGSTDIDLD